MIAILGSLHGKKLPEVSFQFCNGIEFLPRFLGKVCLRGLRADGRISRPLVLDGAPCNCLRDQYLTLAKQLPNSDGDGKDDVKGGATAQLAFAGYGA